MAKRLNIPHRLKKWRKRRSKELRRQFTQEEAAAELGLSAGTFIQYEQGRRGSHMNSVTYEHIIAKTSENGAKVTSGENVAL